MYTVHVLIILTVQRDSTRVSSCRNPDIIQVFPFEHRHTTFAYICLGESTILYLVQMYTVLCTVYTVSMQAGLND
jgi:hypothetical protein